MRDNKHDFLTNAINKEKQRKNIKLKRTKTMKKIILTSAIIFAAVAGVFAQSTTPTPATATLNIKLIPIQSITISTTNNIVNLEYGSVTAYANGVSKDQPDHLKVYSAGGFVVSVNSSVDQLTTAKGSGTIESSGITVLASNGSINNLGLSSYGSPVALGTTPMPFITSTKGGVDERFNVSYSAQGDNAYINKLVSGTDANLATTYTTQVIYTIVPN